MLETKHALDRSLAMEILVVEDDAVIGKSLLKGADEAGHGCIWTKNGFRPGTTGARSNTT